MQRSRPSGARGGGRPRLPSAAPSPSLAVSVSGAAAVKPAPGGSADLSLTSPTLPIRCSPVAL